MHTLEKPAVEVTDYRTSHLAKGASYDANLAGDPFDAYMDAWEQQHVPRILQTRFPAGIGRYLDFACGTGRVTRLMAPLAASSTAVDISASMIEQARTKCPQTWFVLADLTRDDPDLGEFDLASSFRFFGNAQDELREAALHAIGKRIRVGGHLFINSHRNPMAIYALLNRVTGGDAASKLDLPLSKLRALLARHGFEIVHLQPIGAWLLRAAWMARARADSPQSVRNERRFGAAWLAPISPDLLVLARKLR